jgi:cation:H+ antiporter
VAARPDEAPAMSFAVFGAAAVSAARSGAVGLAAGDIVGGNTFDVLFISAADVVSGASVFAAAGAIAVIIASTSILMNAILLAGMVRKGAGACEVDVENVAIVAVWIGLVVVLLG